MGSEALFPNGKSLPNVLNEEQTKLLQNGSSSRPQLACERTAKRKAETRGGEGANKAKNCTPMLLSRRGVSSRREEQLQEGGQGEVTEIANPVASLIRLLQESDQDLAHAIAHTSRL